MKNHSLLIGAALLIFSVKLSAQEDYYGDNLNSDVYSVSSTLLNPTMQAPDVAAFQKHSFVPVSNYTGRANISIPIYEVSVGSMSVPISLSYNSSGVKVNDMASNVGLNWSLKAGGMISRMVRGMEDFHMPYRASSPISFMTPSGWLGYAHPYIDVDGGSNKYNDASPDLFIVNAPGLSTSFVHKKHYQNISPWQSPETIPSPVPVELEHKGNIINETLGMVAYNYYNDYTELNATSSRFGFTNIEVISINGIKYNFGTPELSRYHTSTQSTIEYKFDSHRLDTMYDPITNQTITFEYESYSNYFYDDIATKKNSYGGGNNLPYNSTTSHTVYPVTQRLKKIIFSTGEVEFIYGLNRLDNTGEKGLTEIKVKDKNGVVIKHVKLDYDYFYTSQENNTPQGKRLKLKRVFEVDPINVGDELPGYHFTYDTNLSMPARDSYAHDFLGYSNGSYNSAISDPIPKYYFRNNKITPFYSSSAIELTGNYSLEANVAYAKTYSLIKMTFPTGGENEYEYELNTFGSNSGGGLRLKSQKITDGKGGEHILDYSYINGSIGRMPVFSIMRGTPFLYSEPEDLDDLTSQIKIDTFMTPQSQIEFTNGSFVGYDRVLVTNRVDNGYTIYDYSSPSLYPDLISSRTFPNPNTTNTWGTLIPSQLSIDRDYMRGKLLKETVRDIIGSNIDQDDETRLEKIYNYTYKEFLNISLSYLNRPTTNSNNCYSDDGTFIGDGGCLSFLEEINLPIARFMLTSVVTKDYANNENEKPFITNQNFIYDGNLPLVIQERKSNCIESGTNNCMEMYFDNYDFQMIKETTYPNTVSDEFDQLPIPDVSYLPNVNELITQNRLATPLKITFKNRNYDIIGGEEYYYKDFGNNILSIEKINLISKTGTITTSEMITRRNNKGNIIEYQDKNGVYTSIIYGYNNLYTIAIITGATYNEVDTALFNEFGQNLSYVANLSDLDINVSTEDTLRTWLNNIRTAIANQSNSLNTVITYTYDQGVGVKSITDVRGETIFYEYDEFRRLKSVRDKNGNLLSENEYNYKLQN